MQKSNKKKDVLGDYKASKGTNATRTIQEVLPQKLEQLSKYIESEPLLQKPFREVRCTLGDLDVKGGSSDAMDTNPRKKRKLDDMAKETSAPRSAASVPSNGIIVQLLVVLKKELQQYIDNSNAIKTWITLNIPRIEDGNNFGVGIQEEALNDLGRAEDDAFTSLDSITKYFLTRAKFVTKLLKYPGVEDYRQCINELDEKEYIDIRFAFKDLRNNYAIVLDRITKNLEKISKPRGDDDRRNALY
mmetsp:Transcript_8843/g.9813  ORF Transcript_8843/g.9813 Transcript_8843/m.9813 type:complete len:245 (+) Transcript_8843:36-770(+)